MSYNFLLIPVCLTVASLGIMSCGETSSSGGNSNKQQSADQEVKKKIDSSGGDISISEGPLNGVKLDIPKGTFTENVELSLKDSAPPKAVSETKGKLLSKSVELSANDLHGNPVDKFETPVEIVIPFAKQAASLLSKVFSLDSGNLVVMGVHKDKKMVWKNGEFNLLKEKGISFLSEHPGVFQIIELPSQEKPLESDIPVPQPRSDSPSKNNSQEGSKVKDSIADRGDKASDKKTADGNDAKAAEVINDNAGMSSGDNIADNGNMKDKSDTSSSDAMDRSEENTSSDVRKDGESVTDSGNNDQESIKEPEPVIATELLIGKSNTNTGLRYTNQKELFLSWNVPADAPVTKFSLMLFSGSGCKGQTLYKHDVSADSLAHTYIVTKEGDYSFMVDTTSQGKIYSSSCSHVVTVDTTPPNSVKLLPFKPLGYKVTNRTPKIEWQDTQADISQYQVSLGTQPGRANVSNWVSAGKNKYHTFKLSINPRASYFANVRAVDLAGNIGKSVTTTDLTPITYELEKYLKASNAGNGDKLGTAMAMDGKTLVVGAPDEDEKILSGGAVYVFEKRSNGNWVQTALLRASNLGRQDEFGTSVAIHGNTIVVGAPNEDAPNDSVNNAGAAYVFEKAGNGKWVQRSILRASNRGNYDEFGTVVSVNGSTIVVGVPLEDGANNAHSNSGAAYIFEKKSGQWLQTALLRARGAQSFDNFASAVAAGDGVVAVGHTDDDGANGNTNRMGAIYVYTKNSQGNWRVAQFLRGSATESYSEFGNSIDIDSGTMVVGNEDEDLAYVFEKNSQGRWQETKILKGSDVEKNDNFGQSVSVYKGSIVVSAPRDDWSRNQKSDSGAAYIFVKKDGKWIETRVLRASNAGDSDRYGSSTAAGDETVAVGAMWEDDRNDSHSNSGAVYTYE